jgi:hypothetical protein
MTGAAARRLARFFKKRVVCNHRVGFKKITPGIGVIPAWYRRVIFLSVSLSLSLATVQACFEVPLIKYTTKTIESKKILTSHSMKTGINLPSLKYD